jgi:hypothetical protein
MAKKKAVGKKKPVRKKKPAPKKKVAAKKKQPAKKALATKKNAAAKKKSARRRYSTKARQAITTPIKITSRRGLGPASGGQSGDTQGLSRRDNADSESVEELLEEGQYLEAEAVAGVEDADESEVRTREVPEDDVPEEYQDRDNQV